MTLTTTQTSERYAGDASTTSFPVPFPFYGPDELRVYSTDGTGVQTTLTRGLDYSVLGGNGSPGTVVISVAPAIGSTIAILRATAQTQQVAYANADPFPAATHERALDRLTAIAQEATASLSRAIRIPPGEAEDLVTLPGAAARAGLALTFDSTGQPTASELPTGTAAISAAMVPVVGAATVAAARLAMGGRRYVDVVKDFGADPTNTVDSAAAIQAAINSLSNGEVYLGSGAYGLASGVTLKPNVTVLGEDPLLTSLVARTGGINLLQYTAAGSVADFAIRSLGFNGGGYSSVKALRLDGTDSAKRIGFITLDDLYATQCARGLDLRFCNVTAIRAFLAYNCAVGIYLDQCQTTEVDGGRVLSGSDFGLFINGGAGVYDEGVQIDGFSTIGQVKGLGVTGQEWGSATGCRFIDASGGAAYFTGAGNWQLTGCQFTVGGVPANAALTMDASCYGIQIANSFFANSTYGAVVRGQRHHVKGCHFVNNSNTDIDLTTVKSVVAGNICDSTGVATSIVEQATSDYNSVHGNVTNGTVTIVGANSKTNGDNLVY